MPRPLAAEVLNALNVDVLRVGISSAAESEEVQMSSKH